MLAAGGGDQITTTHELTLARLTALLGDADAAALHFARVRSALVANVHRPFGALADYDEALALLLSGSLDHPRSQALLEAAARAFAVLEMDGWHIRACRVEWLARGHAEHLAGRLSAALAAYQKAADCAEPGDERQAIPLLLALRRPAEALARVQAMPLGHVSRVLLPLCLARTDRREEGSAALQAALARLPQAGDDTPLPLPVLTLLLEAAVALGEPEPARWLVQCLAPSASAFAGSRHPWPGHFVCVARLLGDAALMLGRKDEAMASYTLALEVATQVGSRPEVARTRLCLAELLARSRLSAARRRIVLDHLQFCSAEFEAMGMPPALQQARELRERIESRRQSVHTTPPLPDRLTEREAAVLRLIAAGRSNREIAAELVISERTAGRHITNIYHKIGARGKADATAYALRRGLAPAPDTPR